MILLTATWKGEVLNGCAIPKAHDFSVATPPPPGTNTVISSHGNPFYAVFGAPYLAEGEIAVVRPGEQSGYAIAGKIKLEDWAALD